jgi:hypothetical protein
MDTVLLIGREADRCCQLVQGQLQQRGMHRVLFLTEDRLLPALRFCWTLDAAESDGYLAVDGERVAFAAIAGVLARFSGVVAPVGDVAPADARYVTAEVHALMRGWLASLTCPVVNRLRPELWYRAELTAPDLVPLRLQPPLQLPQTLITTDAAEAAAFAAQCGGAVVYSPLAISSRYPVRDADALQKLRGLTGLVPLKLTEDLHGTPVRVFVVGNRVFADDADETPLAVDDAVVAQCRALGQALGLTFYSVQLLHTDGGAWYCRSVETLPQLYWGAEAVQDAVAAQLAAILTEGAVD